MNAKVLVNGTPMDMPVDETWLEDVKHSAASQALYGFRQIIVDTLAEKFHNEEYGDEESNLDPDELQTLYNMVVDMYIGGGSFFDTKFVSDLIDGTLFNKVKEFYQEILNDRCRWYEVEIEVTGTMYVKVKANNAEAARDIIRETSHYDLADFVEVSDLDFEVYSANESDEPSPYDNKIES